MKELYFQADSDLLKLRFVSASKRGRSFEVSLEVGSRGFFGRHGEVHFLHSDSAKFVTSLRALDKTRQGVARLEAMSPGELWIEILSVDKLGHIHLQGLVTQESSIRPRRLWNSIGFDIELDPSTFPRIVRQFEDFPTEAR